MEREKREGRKKKENSIAVASQQGVVSLRENFFGRRRDVRSGGNDPEVRFNFQRGGMRGGEGRVVVGKVGR